VADGNTPSEPPLSAADVQKWLQQELADLAKASELRTREASALATAFSSGEISSEQAAERLTAYARRWPEALPGTHIAKGANDAELLSEIDKARHPQFAERLVDEGKRRRER
jgi:hypothetical protein